MWRRMKTLTQQGARKYAGFLDLYEWFHAEGARLKKLVTKALANERRSSCYRAANDLRNELPPPSPA